jgi:hypothetical protein
MPDDGPIGTETGSLPFIKYKYDVHDENWFIILVIKLLAHRDVFNQNQTKQLTPKLTVRHVSESPPLFPQHPSH